MTIATGIELPESAIADICRLHEVKELSLFGSAARGEMRPDSDFDLLVREYDILSLVERPGLLKATPGWILEPGKPAEMALPVEMGTLTAV